MRPSACVHSTVAPQRVRGILGGHVDFAFDDVAQQHLQARAVEPVNPARPHRHQTAALQVPDQRSWSQGLHMPT